MVRRTPQSELTIEDLDRELIARGAQIPHQELFKFDDPEREAAMAGVKELYKAANSPNPALASIDTWELYRLLMHKTRQLEENRKRGIWYEDHRMDAFGVMDEQIKKNINCVAAIVFKRDLIDERNGFYTLKVKNYRKAYNLCELEHFHEQPAAAGRVCTGFLVKKDVIATAAHCVLEYNLWDLCFVFGYKMLDPYTPVTQVPKENIYKGKKISGLIYNPKGDGADWALVRLDREVAGQEMSVLSKDMITCHQSIYIIGHPMGLPLKYAPGAKVRGFNENKENLFAADLDTYMGNSGSPVFNADTHEVIGIVVHGDTRDFRWTGQGWASVIYPSRDITSREPQCNRVSPLIAIVMKL